MHQSRIIIFDGCCPLCAALVVFITRHDRHGLFRFVPAQSATGEALQAGLGINALASGTLILIKNGNVFTRSDAALEIARDLDGPVRLGVLINIIPRPLRDAVYGFVAANRHRWLGCKTGSEILSRNDTHCLS